MSAFHFVLPALAVLGALAASSVGSAALMASGAAAGLVWALLLGWLAGRLSGERWAQSSLSAGAFVAAALFGGSLFAMLMYASFLSSPQAMLALMQPPFGGGFAFFLMFNTLIEWLLLPLAVYLNWQMPARRRLLIVGALLYYLGRAWTYLYFVPRIFGFMETPAASAEIASGIVQWVNLSWIRCAIDGVLALLLLSAFAQRRAA